MENNQPKIIIDEKFLKFIKDEQEGFFINKLKKGTQLLIKTNSGSIYKFIILDPRSDKVKITQIEAGFSKEKKGKIRFKDFECIFSGSTFGGSMIRIGYIGKGMHMELPNPKLSIESLKYKIITTTPVENVVIIGDDYEYDLNWDTKGKK